MRALATTALGLDGGATVFKPGGATHAYPRFMSEPDSRLPSDHLRCPALEEGITSRLDHVQQAPIVAQDLDIQLGNALGAGVFGRVYQCSLKLAGDTNRQYLAIKVPLTSMRDLTRATQTLAQEFANAERLLEPALARGLTNAPLPAATYFRILAARCRHAAHVGYAFLHRPIHYFPAVQLPSFRGPVPAIVSERADCTLEYLVSTSVYPPYPLRLHPDGTPPILWTTIAWQFLKGVDFIHSVCGMAHLDLKDTNVFLRGDPSHIRCLIGDFGMLKPADETLEASVPRDGYLVFRGGTPHFCPRVHPGQPTVMTAARLSDYQCLATLAAALVFPPAWHAKNTHVPTAVAAKRFAQAPPPVGTLLDFCAQANTMPDWETLADLCWRRLQPEVETLLQVSAPEAIVAATQRAQAYAADAAEAEAIALTYESPLEQY